jgi:hypothetical protein
VSDSPADEILEKNYELIFDNVPINSDDSECDSSDSEADPEDTLEIDGKMWRVFVDNQDAKLYKPGQFVVYRVSTLHICFLLIFLQLIVCSVDGFNAF